jgi:glycosyltransferase involved in cell wall biosynthesis
MGISACMIVRDEAHLLGRCLKSFQGAFDELNVVDTGSRDGTPAIAADFGARLRSFTACNGEDCELVDGRQQFAHAFGTNFTGWGASWLDLANNGKPGLVLANGDIPVKNLAADAGRVQVIAQASGNWLDAGDLVGAGSIPAVNGRGLAAADFDNDGRVDVAVNSVGGPLLLLRSSGGPGHWLGVNLRPFVPGAIVTVYTRTRQLVEETRAGSSYLSSEDPRVHFGLGADTRVSELEVMLPGGRTIRVNRPGIDRVITVRP